MADISFPGDLNKAEWKKNKGIIAEIAKGSTGIGKLLDQLHTSYDKINFTLLEALGPKSKELKSPTAPETKALMSNVNALLADINELLGLARTAQKQFRASKVVMKSVTAYLDTLIGSAEGFFDRMQKASGG